MPELQDKAHDLDSSTPALAHSHAHTDPHWQIAGIFERADKDGSTEIDFEEFMVWLCFTQSISV